MAAQEEVEEEVAERGGLSFFLFLCLFFFYLNLLFMEKLLFKIIILDNEGLN
jgi:hypothetical protein